MDINNKYLTQLENCMKSNLKKFCFNNFNGNKCKLYFENKMYESLGIDEDTFNYFLIHSFIKNYYVSKLGTPTIDEIKTNTALYALLKNRNFNTAEEFISSNEKIKNFLLQRYIANIDNYQYDYDTMIETRTFLQEYHNYYINKNKQNKKVLIKTNEKKDVE